MPYYGKGFRAPLRTGFPVYPRSCPYMKNITDEEELALYLALRRGRRGGIVLDLGLCSNCPHPECPEHVKHKEYADELAHIRANAREAIAS